MAKSDPVQGGWRRSSASESGDCVEVAVGERSVSIRHSRSPSGPALTFSPREWAAFLTGVRNGEFDLSGAGEPPAAGA